MPIKNKHIIEFVEKNTAVTWQEIVDTFNVSENVARSVLYRAHTKAVKKAFKTQQIETPEGYKGTVIKGKTWQLHDGSWRESLTFDVDLEEEWSKFKEEFLKDLALLGSLNTPLSVKKVQGDICLEISLPDLHFGKGDIIELSENFVECVYELLNKAEKFGVERILLPIGNDGLNSEGKRRTTTAGTPQEDTVDWQTSFRYYWATMAEMINLLAKQYPVDVLIISGNHDMERMFYIGDVLSAYFRNSTQVTVNNNGDYRKYFEYGVNMLMFTHGDKEKVNTLPLLMATEQPEMFARTKYREAHLGHFHKEMLNEFCGIKTRFLPSICKTDDWHKMMGYTHQRAAQAYLWNKKLGLEGYFQINLFNNEKK